MGLKEGGCEGVDRIHLDQDRDNCEHGKKLSGFTNCDEFLD
jgi:hypothetical protein